MKESETLGFGERRRRANSQGAGPLVVLQHGPEEPKKECDRPSSREEVAVAPPSRFQPRLASAAAAAAAAATDDAEHYPPPLPCEVDFMAQPTTTCQTEAGGGGRASPPYRRRFMLVSWKLLKDHRKPKRWDATDTKIACDLSMTPGVLVRPSQLKPIKKPQAGRPRGVASQR
jgi:hypothetical protein